MGIAKLGGEQGDFLAGGDGEPDEDAAYGRYPKSLRVARPGRLTSANRYILPRDPEGIRDLAAGHTHLAEDGVRPRYPPVHPFNFFERLRARGRRVRATCTRTTPV